MSKRNHMYAQKRLSENHPYAFDAKPEVSGIQESTCNKTVMEVAACNQLKPESGFPSLPRRG